MWGGTEGSAIRRARQESGVDVTHNPLPSPFHKRGAGAASVPQLRIAVTLRRVTCALKNPEGRRSVLGRRDRILRHWQTIFLLVIWKYVPLFRLWCRLVYAAIALEEDLHYHTALVKNRSEKRANRIHSSLRNSSASFFLKQW